MQNAHIDYQGAALDFQGASLLAKNFARENQMQDPTIMAWHRHGGPATPPYFDGADPDTWWEKFGTGNGGGMEVSVGDDYQFIIMDASDYEVVGDVPLRNLSDGQGHEYVCYTSLLGKSSDKPTREACTQLDE